MDDIKAITHHELAIRLDDGGWEATVVFDLTVSHSPDQTCRSQAGSPLGSRVGLRAVPLMAGVTVKVARLRPIVIIKG
jgi:hypothetical protein